MTVEAATVEPKILTPDAPVCVMGSKQVALLTTDGEIKLLSYDQAGYFLTNKPCIVCHAPMVKNRVKAEFQSLDLLELYLFVHPSRFTVPTVTGVAKSVGLDAQSPLEDQPLLLMECLQSLLYELSKFDENTKNRLRKIATVMGLNGRGWGWTPYVLAAMGKTYDPKEPIDGKTSLAVWDKLAEWSERAPPPPPTQYPVTEEEAEDTLKSLLATGDRLKEDRPQQREYARTTAQIFKPKEDLEEPHVLMAEAGTGIGKTVGYLAPAYAWARKNEASVWVSTFTKNLQQQLEDELDRIYPNEQLKEQKAAILKGRENYLCLLNYEDMANGAPLAKAPTVAIAAGLMARWIMETKDGDYTGKDFQGWIPSLLGFANTKGLALKSGECLFSACDHYNRCFKERAIRKSRHAEIVIANHALVMIQTALAHSDDAMPSRLIFDEGHHLFQAADSAFAAHLTGRQTRDLRRWLLGSENSTRKRNRGLKKRAEEMVSAYPEDEKLLLQILHHATSLPAGGWIRRLKENNPQGPAEIFFLSVFHQVNTRSTSSDHNYSIECPTFPVLEAVTKTAPQLKNALLNIQVPMMKLATNLNKRIAEDDEDLMDADTRRRIDALARSLERRAQTMLAAWIGMLEALEKTEQPEQFVDWMEIEKIDGALLDTGFYRHWVDPMKPFSQSLLPHAHGLTITSATLRDKSGDENEDWKRAEIHTGARYLSTEPKKFSAKSPFNYQDCARVYVLTDVNKTRADHVSGALKSLINASGGGALALFTSINRLKAIHNNLINKLDVALYSQHIDQMDSGTLIDIFREDENSCLLGTDAMRDGVDVPGKSLRLMTFDRVPWPRPTLLHKARRKTFGGKEYDEMITRMKLQQAFGRLIRSNDDKGVFVMMDSAMPSRLLTAFPENVEVKRLGLAEVCIEIKEFLKT